MTEQNPRSTQNSLLIQLVQDMAEIKATIKNYADLELRIRSLEKSLWSNAWVTGVLSAAISAGIVAIILKTIG